MYSIQMKYQCMTSHRIICAKTSHFEGDHTRKKVNSNANSDCIEFDEAETRPFYRTVELLQPLLQTHRYLVQSNTVFSSIKMKTTMIFGKKTAPKKKHSFAPEKNPLKATTTRGNILRIFWPQNNGAAWPSDFSCVCNSAWKLNEDKSATMAVDTFNYVVNCSAAKSLDGQRSVFIFASSNWYFLMSFAVSLFSLPSFSRSIKKEINSSRNEWSWWVIVCCSDIKNHIEFIVEAFALSAAQKNQYLQREG